MDRITKQQRSFNMSRIRSKNTSPELLVRKSLREIGIRYRLYSPNLPGKPDIILSKTKTAIFVNGCFWHQHPGCKRKTLPKSNKVYWHLKLKRNIEKQKEDISAIEKLGWKVFIIWECETKNYDELFKKVKLLIEHE